MKYEFMSCKIFASKEYLINASYSQHCVLHMIIKKITTDYIYAMYKINAYMKKMT